MSETSILNHIKLTLSPAVVLWRNNRGTSIYEAKDGKKQFVPYGVGPDGAADSVGYTKKIITQEMVGKIVAIFTAVEIKTLEGVASTEQKDFVKQVRADGGYSGFATCVQEARKIVGL